MESFNQIESGKLIKQRRKTLSLTQLDLANMLNVSVQAVSKWENGDSFPDSSNQTHLAEVLKITLYELLEGKIDEQKRKSIDKAKLWQKIVIIAFSILIPLFILLTFYFFMNHDTVHVYSVSSDSSEVMIQGVIFETSKYYDIYIENIYVLDDSDTLIKSLNLYSNDILIYNNVNLEHSVLKFHKSDVDLSSLILNVYTDEKEYFSNLFLISQDENNYVYVKSNKK